MIISAQVVLGYVGSKNLRRRKWRSGPLPEGEGRYDYSETGSCGQAWKPEDPPALVPFPVFYHSAT